MQWELTPEQTAFQSVLRDWLRERCPARTLRHWLDTGDHATFAARFAEEGWFSVGAAEELGGQGGGLVELAITAEELGRRAAPSSAWLASMVALPALSADAAKDMLTTGAPVVLVHPADRVPGAVATAAVPADPAVPPDADPAQPTVPPDADPAGLAVPTVLAADQAHRLVILDADRLALVDADAATVHPRALTDRTRSAADVHPAGVTGTVLDADPAAALHEAALRAAVLTAADSLGLLATLLEDTVAYTTQRHQFGVPIGSFQAVKHAAAQLLVTVEAARSIVYLAAASVDARHPDAPLHAAAAKAQVTADVATAVDTALTLHGAIGYTWEHDLQLYYKRAKLNRVLYGSPQTWNDRIACVLGLANPAS